MAAATARDLRGLTRNGGRINQKLRLRPARAESWDIGDDPSPNKMAFTKGRFVDPRAPALSRSSLIPSEPVDYARAECRPRSPPVRRDR